jgi:hypothetical protein
MLGLYVLLGADRIDWWWWLAVGWPEVMAVRVSQTRGYPGHRLISHGPDWWAAPYSSVEDRIVGDPVYQKETSRYLASPPRYNQ